MIKLEHLKQLQDNKQSFYIYFSAPACSVCEALQPKLIKLMKEEFPKLQAFPVNTSQTPEIAAQLGLYTNPSLLVFMEGNEVLRRSRVISLKEVTTQLERYYQLLFK
ncbi:thioredoxin family protein [Ancylomarina longa]|uniref:Thioredoxin n=1 Tax=Ancylomarina longa TaxID=2487017 RepID=A0A434AGP7_9BACT|nr:thioredoxin family protein [Ancylomarina longa]RUT73585.1 thioredoxin [Ancylomarina longa]